MPAPRIYRCAVLPRQRVATTWSNDYQLLAQLQTQVGNYAEALHDIDNAIADAPWQLDFYTQRRDIEKKMGTVDPATVNLHFAEGLRAAGAYHAQTGDDGLAVKRYLLAFMTLSSATTLSATAVASECPFLIVAPTPATSRKPTIERSTSHG